MVCVLLIRAKCEISPINSIVFPALFIDWQANVFCALRNVLYQQLRHNPNTLSLKVVVHSLHGYIISIKMNRKYIFTTCIVAGMYHNSYY